MPAWTGLAAPRVGSFRRRTERGWLRPGHGRCRQVARNRDLPQRWIARERQLDQVVEHPAEVGPAKHEHAIAHLVVHRDVVGTRGRELRLKLSWCAAKESNLQPTD